MMIRRHFLTNCVEFIYLPDFIHNFAAGIIQYAGVQEFIGNVETFMAILS